MSATSEQDMQPTVTSKMGRFPIDTFVVVDSKHPLKDDFFYPRNVSKPEQSMIESIRNANGPIYAPTVWPWKDADGVQKLIVIDGNQRVNAAKAAGLTELKADVQIGMSKEDAAKMSAIANSQRKENTFADICVLATRLVKPNKETKALTPQGMSYEEVAKAFGKTHTWVRNHVKAWVRLPNNIKDAIQKGKLGTTVAFNALLNDVLLADSDALQARFAELLGDGGPIEGGEKETRAARPTTGAKAKYQDHMNKNEWQLVAKHPNTPEDASILIRLFLEEITIAQAVSEGLDWFVKPSAEDAAAVKGKGKGKKPKKAKDGEVVASSSTQNSPVSSDIDMDLFF